MAGRAGGLGPGPNIMLLMYNVKIRGVSGPEKAAQAGPEVSGPEVMG